MTLVLADPALRELVDRHRIEIVQLLAAAPDGRDEVRIFENGEMLAHGLPRHQRSGLGKPLAKLVQGLTIPRVEPIEKLSSAAVGQRPEHLVHVDNMQPFGCLSSRKSASERTARAPREPILPAPRRWGRSAWRRGPASSTTAACAAAAAPSRRWFRRADAARRCGEQGDAGGSARRRKAPSSPSRSISDRRRWDGRYAPCGRAIGGYAP